MVFNHYASFVMNNIVETRFKENETKVASSL